MEIARNQAEQLTQMQLNQKQTLLNNVTLVTEHLNTVTKAGEENNYSFEEMNFAFQEIANGATEQVDSTLSINESIQDMNALVKEMSDSIHILTERTNEAALLSDQGKNTMDQLAATNADFRVDIESVASVTTELIDRLAETSQFSATIQDIANQQNGFCLMLVLKPLEQGSMDAGLL